MAKPLKPTKQTSGKAIDWDTIEIHYRAGVRSLRNMGAEFGMTEANIRAHAKKHGWIRNPAALKREMVNSKLSGAASQPVSQEITQAVEQVVDQEVEADVEDMNTALGVYRKILRKLDGEIETVRGFKSYKVIAEAATVAVNGIRRIRGLDAPTDVASLSDEQLIAMAQGKVPK